MRVILNFQLDIKNHFYFFFFLVISFHIEEDKERGLALCGLVPGCCDNGLKEFVEERDGSSLSASESDELEASPELWKQQ